MKVMIYQKTMHMEVKIDGEKILKSEKRRHYNCNGDGWQRRIIKLRNGGALVN